MKHMMSFGREGANFPSDRLWNERSFGTDLRDRMLKDPADPFWKRDHQGTERKDNLREPYQPQFPRKKWFDFPSIFKDRRSFLETTAPSESDQDLDASIAADPSQLDKVLKEHQEEKSTTLGQVDVIPEAPHDSHRSQFSFVSISTKQLPDGSYEKKETRRDSLGNEEVIITQSDGQKTSTFTTRRHPNGVEETTETVNDSTKDTLGSSRNDGLLPYQKRQLPESPFKDKPSAIIRRFWNSLWSS